MHRTFAAPIALRVLRWLSLMVAVAVVTPASANDSAIEKQVQLLQKKAIEEDNLNVNYAAAINKLQTAIGKCAGNKCATGLRGALLRDLGAMQVLNGSVDEGRASFAQALAVDASLELDPAYKTPTLQGVWSDAKKKVAGGGDSNAEAPAGSPAGAPAGALPPSVVGAAQPAAGDFAHQPAGEQLVRAPLPIYAEYLGTEKLLRAVVKYKGAGTAEWKTLELRRMDTGYGALLPCKDVTLGVMQYYIQGFSATNDAIATSGTRTRPYSVSIVQKLSGPPPSLPHQDPPLQCGELAQAECPPGFPGCSSSKRAAGEDCESANDCQSNSCGAGKCVDKKGAGEACEGDDDCVGESCADRRCAAAKKTEGDDCGRDDECASGSCKDSKCSAGTPGNSRVPASRVWIGVAGSLDFFLMPAANEVCRLNQAGNAPINGQGYSCVDPTTGANFPNSPAENSAIQVRQGDTVQSGLSRGDLRLLLSMDYALDANVMLGFRAGYVLFTNPASAPGPAFAPLHVEARFTYLIGHEAIAKLAPMVFVGAGVGEFDAYVPTTVGVAPGKGRSENAWLVAGPAFGAIGGGVRVPLAKTIATTLAAKVEGAFGGTAGFLFGFAPELGLQLGF